MVRLIGTRWGGAWSDSPSLPSIASEVVSRCRRTPQTASVSSPPLSVSAPTTLFVPPGNRVDGVPGGGDECLERRRPSRRQGRPSRRLRLPRRPRPSGTPPGRVTGESGPAPALVHSEFGNWWRGRGRPGRTRGLRRRLCPILLGVRVGPRGTGGTRSTNVGRRAGPCLQGAVGPRDSGIAGVCAEDEDGRIPGPRQGRRVGAERPRSEGQSPRRRAVGGLPPRVRPRPPDRPLPAPGTRPAPFPALAATRLVPEGVLLYVHH